ncbi:ArsR family transcriptional regulator [Parashewanella curva]|uniref:ArsR family transcriptional regulator n=1 Tax=Parashewanella curva TaxID=2338552 RepID=A0A3L8PY19_9GAMM|nr:metalloregulator ArsR/SmtB family transcription factor [Parashewanella curva]RLV59523.1 ArsR family transcriptional regulator [Parashewanella curva]
MDPLFLFKALADTTRLNTILLITHQQELCVCELMEALDENQPKISRHLALLKKQQVLMDRREGQWVFYRLNPELPPWFTTMLNELIAQATPIFIQTLARLDEMGDRPSRQGQCCN